MPVFDQDYWNTKWPQAAIIYSGRALRGQKTQVGVDVRNFIVDNDAILKSVIQKYELQRSSYNDTALAIQKWVVQFLYYKDDQEADQCPEFWQFPFESLEMGTGDCEDFGILIASLMANAGVPMYRIKVAAGWVQERPTAPQGGHCYALYLADKKDDSGDQNWVILDGCYLEDSALSIEQKPFAKNGGQQNNYKDLWFTFNGQYSWAQTALALNGRMAARGQKSIGEQITDQSLPAIMAYIDRQYRK